MDVVFENNSEQAVTEDLGLYKEIFLAVPNLLEVFHNPAVQREAKERLLAELMVKYPVTQLSANFLRILVQHNRIRYFQQIFDIYMKHVNDRKGILSAKITTAASLSEQELKKLNGIINIYRSFIHIH